MFKTIPLIETDQDFLDSIKSVVDTRLKRLVKKAISDYPVESIRLEAQKHIEDSEQIQRIIINEKLQEVTLYLVDNKITIDLDSISYTYLC